MNAAHVRQWVLEHPLSPAHVDLIYPIKSGHIKKRVVGKNLPQRLPDSGSDWQIVVGFDGVDHLGYQEWLILLPSVMFTILGKSRPPKYILSHFFM